MNHENRLLFTYGEKDGISGLILLKDPKIAGHDTAFEFRSKPFSVIGSAVFTFSIVASGSVDMIISSPFGESYFNLIEWYDNEGNIISATPFKYSSRLHSPTETKISGDIPANASKAVIRIGADRPNILENDYVIFSSLDFSSQNPKGDVYPKGNFISRPFYRPNQGKLSWDATVPSQTSVSFQIATARDNNGVPDEWSAFVGPGNNPLRHFTESGTELPTFSPNRPWVCYKASFIGLNEHSPELRSVTISQFTDRNWKGKDRCCPEITRLTPSCPQDASAPVAFHITDDSLVNWSQARLFLDGRDVTSQTRRESDVFIFQPEQPLKKSTPDIRDIATWRLVQNHNFAIAFHDLP
ncbi:MAG: hypothetical protein J6X55_08130, partial [Victivallales bacterium]|nr:hypothetical protein [Victivallales bacterium]